MDSAIVCGVGADVLDNTLRVDHHHGSTDRMESDREEQQMLVLVPVPVIAMKTMEASRTTA